MTAFSASSASILRRIRKPAPSSDIVLRLTAEEQATLRSILAETAPPPAEADGTGHRLLWALVGIGAAALAAACWLLLDPDAADALARLATHIIARIH